MDRKALLAFLLTASMLLSGCTIPFTSDDNVPIDEVNLPPTITLNEVFDISYGQAVEISGVVDDEYPADGRVSIAFSIPWGTVYEVPDADGLFSYSMGGLEPGAYSVSVTAVDDLEQSSQTITKNFTVIPPSESDVQITLWRNEIWFEVEEETSVTGQISHTYLETCQLNFTWVGGGVVTTINYDSSSGMFSIPLGELSETSSGHVAANCGRYSSSQQSSLVAFNPLVEPVSDEDGDGIPDENDTCPDGESFSSSQTTDYDADGCYDLSEDLDDDNDGLGDTLDECQKGELGWLSTPASDKDSDGCRDETEDSDDDGDSIIDSEDSCLDSPYGWVSNFVTDYDRDGCRDLDADLDDDNDTILDGVDSCPNGVIGWIPDSSNDKDSDGCRDSDEDDDDDNDMVPDLNDSCPDTLANFTVNEYGCAAYEWDDDGDGVMDDMDLCQGTPTGLDVNEQGCADLDDDGVFANIDQCPSSPDRWTVDGLGCAVIQYPIPWDAGPYSTSRYGVASNFNFATKYDGNWQFSTQWDGNSSYLFVFLQSSNSYMNSLWNQNVGDLLSDMPENGHIFFGSYDSDWQNDVDLMAGRVSNYRGSQSSEKQLWIDENVHFVNQQAGSIGGGLGGVIQSWGKFYYGIDRFQQWREIGSLYNWARTLQSQPEYRFDYIANEAGMWNEEFFVEKRSEDPGITTVDIFAGDRHSGGWSGGYTTHGSATLPSASVMSTFNTLEVYLEHSCSEHRDRYGIDDDGDGSADRYGGCHEWDYLHYLKICDEGSNSSCGTEFVRYITTYGREGRWVTDISPLLWMIKDGGLRNFTYQGANGGWLNATLMFSNWDDDGLRPTHGEVAFTGGYFNSNYNNESAHDRRYDINTTTQWDKVEIAAIVTGHGFGNDPNNCAEFCNHEHFFELNGNDVTHDFPMAGNGSLSSDKEGCQKTVDMGTVANQLGSWPFGRAGWCPGLDVEPWLFDITNWVNWAGQNEVLYQGLWDGQQYTETSNNPNIRALIWVVYYENTSLVGPNFVDLGQPIFVSDDSVGEPVLSIIQRVDNQTILVREEEAAVIDD